MIFRPILPVRPITDARFFGALLAALCSLSPLLFASPNSAAAGKLLEMRRSEIFGVERKRGAWSLLDPESHYRSSTGDIDKLTFDTSNGPVLANLGAGGALRTLTIFRGDYRATTTGWPGVWMAKDSATTGEYAFTMEWQGQTIELAGRLPGDSPDPKKGGRRVDWDLSTGLLDNLLPVTTLREPTGHFTATLALVAPVSADGRLRPAAAIYGLLLRNTGTTPLEASVTLPANSASRNANTSSNWASKDPFDYEIALADAAPGAGNLGSAGEAFDADHGAGDALPLPKVPVKLQPGGVQWIPAVLYQPGEEVPALLAARGSAAWFRESLSCLRSRTGHLETPDHPWLGAFFERELMQSLQGLAMKPNPDGTATFIGSSWGSYEATRLTWMKDCFYSALPFTSADPALARQAILWFAQYGVRPRGTRIRGGVNHSISLSVSSLMLAGLYYQNTADTAFFRENPALRAGWDEVVEALFASRPKDGPWMFPSDFISDGPCGPDLHTGSNLAVWFAAQSYARLIRDVYSDPEAAAKMQSAADNIRAAILAHSVVKGPEFAYLNEAAPRPGANPRPFHDGEESETTLAVFYRFLAPEDPLYADTMRFAVSPENPNYNPAFFGLKWKQVPITSPGYNKALGATNSAAELFAEHGGFTELRRATDGDGSLWWWPYGYRGEPVYGSPIRAFAGIGKAGWTAGVFSTLFASRFLGVECDAPARRFHWRPSPVIGSFRWTDFPLGNDRFSVSWTPKSAAFRNGAAHPLELVADLPAKPGARVSINGAEAGSTETVQTVWGQAARIVRPVKPGEEIRVELH
jgi:hypothetical protein